MSLNEWPIVNDSQVPYTNDVMPRAHCSLVDYTQYYLPFHQYAVATFCAAGLAGHAVVIFVLSRKSIFSSMNVLMMALSVAQSCLLISYWLFTVLYNLAEHECRAQYWSQAWVWAHFLANHIFVYSHSVVVWTVVALSVIRSISLTRMFRLRQHLWFTYRHAYLVCTCISILCLCLCSPITMFTQVQSDVAGNYRPQCLSVHPWHNQSSVWQGAYVVAPTAQHRPVFTIVHYMFTFGCKLVPCGIVVVVSITMAFQLQAIKYGLTSGGAPMSSSAHPVSRLNGGLSANPASTQISRGPYKRTTGLIIVVMLLFICVELPSSVLLVYFDLEGPDIITCYIGLIELEEISTILFSSINFVLFCLMSSQFRNEFCSLLRRCLCAPAATVHSVNNSSDPGDRVQRSAPLTGPSAARLRVNNEYVSRPLLEETTFTTPARAHKRYSTVN